MPYFAGAPELSTPGSGAVPAGETSVVGPTHTAAFQGFTPPFVKVTPSGGVYGYWVDANGKEVPNDVAGAWEAQEAEQGRSAPAVVPNPDGTVSSADMAKALDQYRGAIDKANTQYDAVLGHTPSPTPASTVTPVQSTVDVGQVRTAAPAQRLQTALQGQTRVATTQVETSQADQARALALQNVSDLQATAAGGGAGQQAAAARLQLALQRSGEMASGRAAQARGAERRGLRREAMLEGGRRALEGATALEAQSAQERQAAQGQLGQQIQATRSTDVDVAAKQAELDQQRRTLTAQLDAARQSNNQQAVNEINAKMADLEARRQEYNATARNQVQARADDQGFQSQNINNQTGLEVSRLTEEQRVANERLKLDASKAAQDAAQGLLTENARQEQLAFAREQLRQAKDQADRQFWGNLISSLLSGATAVGAAAVTKSDRRAKENIRPVKDDDLAKLAQAVRKSLATWNYKQGEGPEGERAGPMAQDLEGTRLGRAVVSEMDDGRKGVDYGQLATLLAAATVKARKREAV